MSSGGKIPFKSTGIVAGATSNVLMYVWFGFGRTSARIINQRQALKREKTIKGDGLLGNCKDLLRTAYCWAHLQYPLGSVAHNVPR